MNIIKLDIKSTGYDNLAGKCGEKDLLLIVDMAAHKPLGYQDVSLSGTVPRMRGEHTL